MKITPPTIAQELIWKPWHVSNLALAAIRIRAGEQLDLARAELAQHEDDSWADRKRYANELLDQLQRVERRERVADEDWFDN